MRLSFLFLPLSFPLLDNLFCVLANCGTSYATMHFIIAFFCPLKIAAHSARILRTLHFTMDDRMKLNEHQLDTKLLAVAHRETFLSPFRSGPLLLAHSWRRAHFCSLPPTWLLLFHLQSCPVFLTSLSHLISPDTIMLANIIQLFLAFHVIFESY